MSPAQSRNLRRELAAAGLDAAVRTFVALRASLGDADALDFIERAIAEHDAECSSIEAEAADEREGVAA